MCSMRNPEAIRVGLVADEPIILEGLTSIFDEPTRTGHAPLIPVPGTLDELLADASTIHLVLDLHQAVGGLEMIEAIRKARPELRLIVIGPEGKDELVLDSIIAGARAYLDLNATPQMLRQAIEVVTEGSIWAARRLLSKLIDRLLAFNDTSLTNSIAYKPLAPPTLTKREQQVLELILVASSNREIARRLGIEERTVKAHVSRLMRKSGVDNRIELSMRFLNLDSTPGTASSEPQPARGAASMFTN